MKTKKRRNRGELNTIDLLRYGAAHKRGYLVLPARGAFNKLQDAWWYYCEERHMFYVVVREKETRADIYIDVMPAGRALPRDESGTVVVYPQLQAPLEEYGKDRRSKLYLAEKFATYESMPLETAEELTKKAIEVVAPASVLTYYRPGVWVYWNGED